MSNIFVLLVFLISALILISACDFSGLGPASSSSPAIQGNTEPRGTATPISDNSIPLEAEATVSAFPTQLSLDPDIALKTPVTSDDYYQAGELADHNQDTQEAIEYYKKAIQLDPKNEKPYQALAAVYITNGQCDDALADLNSLLQLGPSSATSMAYMQRGKAFGCLGSKTDVVQDYKLGVDDETSALKLNPNFPDAYTARGILYFHMQLFEEAIVDYTKAIQIDADYADAYLNRGLAYEAESKSDSALSDYDKYVALRPSDWQGYYERGYVHTFNQTYTDAITELTKAIAINPKHQRAYLYRGESYAGLEDYTHALADFAQGIALAPDDPIAYSARGRAEEHTNDYKQAISDFTKAISLSNEDNLLPTELSITKKDKQLSSLVDAYWGRGQVYEVEKDYLSAITDYLHVTTLAPKSPFGEVSYAGLGRSYREVGAYTLSLVNFNQALALNPNMAQVYTSRGLTYIKQDEYAKAFADFDQAEKLGDVAGAYLGRGEAYAQEGDKQRAITAFNMAISLSGKDTGVKSEAQEELAKLQDH